MSHPTRSRGHASPRRTRGFTLLEVLFVVAILALVGLIALPDPTASEAYRLELAASQVAVALRQARDEAVRSDQTLEFERAGNEIRVHRIDDGSVPPARIGLLPDPATRRPLELDLSASRSTARATLTSTLRFDVLGARDSVFLRPDGVPAYLDGAGTLHRLLEGTLTVSDGVHARTIRLDPLTSRISRQ